MPIDYSKYPPNWKTEIRPRILKRAGDCCENPECGVRNYSMQPRRKKRQGPGIYFIKIVLTIAHLDHDEGNWDVKDERLKALCQRCHIRYDIAEKKRRRKLKNESIIN